MLELKKYFYFGISGIALFAPIHFLLDSDIVKSLFYISLIISFVSSFLMSLIDLIIIKIFN